MILESDNIRLTRLTHNKIELVRSWRNDPKISQFMEFRDYISPDMQAKWFAENNNDNNFFFIISVNNEDVGLIDIKRINYQDRSGEIGIFIHNDTFRGTGIAQAALTLLLEFSFEHLNLEFVIIHILKQNIRSKLFFAKYGFVIESGQERFDNQLYRLTKSQYQAISK